MSPYELQQAAVFRVAARDGWAWNTVETGKSYFFFLEFFPLGYEMQ